MKVIRNKAIIANYKRELSLATKVVRDRTKYSRKLKHRKDKQWE